MRALAQVYISRPVQTERGKGKIERVVEEVDIAGEGDSYQQVQQFMTDSPWEALELMTTATVTGTTTEGDAFNETHELTCNLQKIEGNWLVTEVTVVEVLKK